MSFEQKTILKTAIGLCFSAVLACVKFVIGIFTDYNLCIIAAYTVAMLLAKLECVLAIKTRQRTPKKRNLTIAIFLFASSFLYTAFMSRMFFIERSLKEYSLIYVEMIALIAFAEFGCAIAGIVRTKNKGLFYRDVKIINFCISLTAILTTQITILDYTSTYHTDFYNACTGVGVGCFISLCAIYILMLPKISLPEGNYNVFELIDEAENKLIDMKKPTAEIPVCRSTVYGSYIYRATIADRHIRGSIERVPSIWKNMHLAWKILCCILSELLIFFWLIGWVIFFFRSIDLPKRLITKMERNGFKNIP